MAFNFTEYKRKVLKSKINQELIRGERFYKITKSDSLRPFFLSIVSDSNHWMFISSNGGLSAGRKNSEHALFPYYTDDKITSSAEITGSKSIFLIKKERETNLWEPFSIRQEGIYSVSRNIYKNIYGNKVLFEEVNHDLGLTFRYQWNSSNKFGFVKKAELINNANQEIEVTILDGIQNIVPSGVSSDLQNEYSNLVDAYKRSELLKDSGIGIYALSAIIVDKAEPSESLKATVSWSLGFEKSKHLLSSLQLKEFRHKRIIKEETDIKAEKGAYFICNEVVLLPKMNKEWKILADVDKSQSSIVELSEVIRKQNNLNELVEQDIEDGTQKLIELVGATDGLQLTADHFRDTRHFSNSLFNIMRGGIFDNNYQISKKDLIGYLSKANLNIYNGNIDFIHELPDYFTFFDLRKRFNKDSDPDLRRLCLEYLPLSFSRRHGDPSRPWNKFSINTRSEIDGSKILDYEGNWRDIFQNWEALVGAYPAFIESMIFKFLNASTFDGYNPYRVTKGGFDWETIEADNPWSYIGYWGDHQIIYLLKFLEFINSYSPERLQQYFDQDLFVYANVPYKIKNYENILINPKDTINFDFELDKKIRDEKSKIGADGALLKDENGAIHRVNFIEKILASLLSKLSNFIPGGGIWMNTQRPEWNDANNALVGNGVSMVTLYYIRRFLILIQELLGSSDLTSIKLSNELVDFYKSVRAIFEENQSLLEGHINEVDRKLILDKLGEAGSIYRQHIYNRSFWGPKRSVSLSGLKSFIDLTNKYMEHTIRSNKRPDQLYHAYNLMSVIPDNKVAISNLSEMLEGQVAVLSSKYLSSEESLQLLNGLKKSKLFRDDQYSYLLYPNKELPRFLEKNIIPEKAISESKLLTNLLQDDSNLIIEKDIKGEFHFNGNFKNANDLQNALSNLSNSKYQQLAEEETDQLLGVFEDVFNHKEFTGRSGTFYGYEGLGSIYWHMVSKLQLAVQECCLEAIKNKESDEVIGGLLEHYYEINEGIGVHKSPELYGAFSTDPYSHTPGGKGAQQPGMTGQVKEDILCRFGELGVFVINGCLLFNPLLLRKEEFLKEPSTFEYPDIYKHVIQLELEEGSLAFTYCQVAVIYKLSDKTGLKVEFKNNEVLETTTLKLDASTSSKIFERTGEIKLITVYINK